jgi:hypothetical protein
MRKMIIIIVGFMLPLIWAIGIFIDKVTAQIALRLP